MNVNIVMREIKVAICLLRGYYISYHLVLIYIECISQYVCQIRWISSPLTQSLDYNKFIAKHIHRHITHDLL